MIIAIYHSNLSNIAYHDVIHNEENMHSHTAQGGIYGM